MGNICPLCSQQINIVNVGGPLELKYSIACARCGNFFASDRIVDAPQIIDSILGKNRFLLSVATRKASEISKRTTRNVLLLITTENISEIANRVNSKGDVISAAEEFLIYLSEIQESFESWKEFSFRQDYPLAVCRGPKDFVVIINYLLETKLIQEYNNSSYNEKSSNTLDSKMFLRLSPSGFQRITELRKAKHKTNAFVAMSFDRANLILQDAYENAMKKAIEDTTTLKALRADKEEYNNDINDWILGQIRQSAFMISDFTGNRGGVYLETGFAMGLDIQVIFTCFDSVEDQNNMHFDTEHRNHIFWKTPSHLYERLRNRIQATVPQEYLK